MPDIMSSRINRLPERLINQIAAGEVIERPASVVKELLENSLDAGATRVQVDIEKAGSRLIGITDNGCGIHRDDLVLALERHTTSKLRDAPDLARIATLGFRGEALSSIASVSRLSIVSRRQEDEQAWRLELPVNGSDIIRPAALPPGTRIEIRDLFYNTPARRKFLRSDRTEFLHIQEILKRFALGRPDLNLQLQHNHRRLLNFTDDSGSPLRRIHSVLGRQFTERALPINEQVENIHLYGWIGPADLTRSSTDMQFVYLNGRMIRDKLVNHAIRLAYQECLYPGRQPLYVLYLDMDLAAVDVNVHPTKHEVRFRDTRQVHDFIYGSLVRHLDPKAVNQARHSTREFEQAPLPRTCPAGEIPGRIRETPGNYRPEMLHCLLQGQFILAEQDDRLLLLDTRQARIAIARSRLQSASKSQPVPARPLLVPVIYKTDSRTCELLVELAGPLQRLAVEMTRVSPGSMQVRSLPRCLPFADSLALVDDLALWPGSKKPAATDVAPLIDRLAGHANDLAPVQMSASEMQALLDDYRHSGMAVDTEEGTLRELDADSLRDILRRGR